VRILGKKRLLLILLVACLGLVLTGRLQAQALTPLHSFDDINDGRGAENELVLSGHTLYAVATSGGSYDRGTVYSLNLDGSGFTVLHNFTPDVYPPDTNLDGSYPQGELIVTGNTLYGTTSQGGASLDGTIFRVNTDGTGYTNLHSFDSLSYDYPISTNYDGAYPVSGLVLSGGTLFGITPRGGTLGNGTVFAVNVDGTGFTNLHNLTSAEGAYSQGGLVLSGDTLYGTAYQGASGSGTVFKLNTNGSGFTVLHTFTATPNQYPYKNTDGSHPDAGVILSGNTLYGTTVDGGTNGYGVVFAVNTDGTCFTNLHNFTALSSDDLSQTNCDGAAPQAGLTVAGNILYGTATGGGRFGAGTIFALATDGTAFTVLHHFPLGEDAFINLHINADGNFPRSGLLFSDLALYGSTAEGGGSGYGTIYRFSLLPEISLSLSGSAVVIAWPEHPVGFTNAFALESSTNLGFPLAWTPVLPAPTTFNGLNTVTNSVSASQMFFRLRQQPP
jgi:uncharacterized repeat protein (TIGR03803 family)